MCFQNKNAKREEKVIMRDFKDLKIAVAGTGARDIIGSTKKTYDK